MPRDPCDKRLGRQRVDRVLPTRRSSASRGWRDSGRSCGPRGSSGGGWPAGEAPSRPPGRATTSGSGRWPPGGRRGQVGPQPPERRNRRNTDQLRADQRWAGQLELSDDPPVAASVGAQLRRWGHARPPPSPPPRLDRRPSGLPGAQRPRQQRVLAGGSGVLPAMARPTAVGARAVGSEVSPDRPGRSSPS
jgi:hypothetical protein